jgi:hypothetical protein
MTIGSTSIVLLTLLAQAAPPAPAAQDKLEAQELLSLGARLYKKGDYTGALEKFNDAYAAYSSPKIWFNIAQANRDLGRPVEALEAFQKFLDCAPDASPEDRADALASVVDLQKRLGHMTIVCDATGAQISLDGKPLGPAPIGKPIWAVPGLHQLTAIQKDAAPAVVSVEVRAEENATVVLRVAPPAIPAVPAVVPPTVTAPPPVALVHRCKPAKAGGAATNGPGWPPDPRCCSPARRPSSGSASTPVLTS